MNSPLNVAICEDVRKDAANLQELVQAFDAAPVSIDIYQSGESFLETLPSKRYDLVFMDVYMGGLSGIEAAKALRKLDTSCQIVFTTQSTDHALDSYGVDAMQYLVKPGQITKENIDKVILRCLRLRERTVSEVCTVVAEGQRRDIPMRDILYAEAFDKQCHIHIQSAGTEEKVVTTMKFEGLAAMLPPPRFLRSHRSYIVNLEHAAKIHEDIIMSNGDIVYIRRGDRTKCEIALNEWRLSQVKREI